MFGTKSVLSLCCALLLGFAPQSLAATKAGDKCSNLGRTKVVSGKTLICKKQGKSQVWTLAKKAPTPAPTPMPSTTAVPTPSPTPSPSISPMPTTTPTPVPTIEVVPDSLTMNDSFDELALKVAWKSFNARMSVATNPKTKLEVRTGDKTDKLRASEYLKSLERSIAFWDDIYSSTKPVVASLSYFDEYSWMESQWKLFGLNPSEMGGESSFKSGGADCNQGSATLQRGTDPFFWGCLASRGSIDFIGVQKFAGHEYTHIVQSYLIEWKSGSYKRSALPFLFTEGSADFYGIATASKNESEFLANWNESRTRGFFGASADKAAIKTWNTEKWLFALNENAKNNQIPESPWVQYYSGREVTARLIGLKGHEGFVDFMRRTEASQDWKKSLQEVYAITWEQFSAKMAAELVEITKKLVP